MTTVLFVHGTGVRADRFQGTFEQVSAALLARRADLEVRPCFWGADLGSKLYANGASIPPPDSTRAVLQVAAQNEDIALWSQLQEDPMFELRLLTLDRDTTRTRGGFHPARISVAQEIKDRLLSAPATSEAGGLFRAAGLDETIGEAGKAVAGSAAFQRLAEDPGLDRELAWAVVIRATVAEALGRAELAGMALPVLYDPAVRDGLIRDVHAVLAEEYRSAVGAWTKRKAGEFAAGRVTASVAKKRRLISEASYPFAGDVLLYQRDGAAIRDFVRDRIEDSTPPVIVLAHSLGGIICFDLLAGEELGVECLVTVGTAAPLFYELDSIRCLRAGQPLPQHFPKWINIYDGHDFLSYIGGGLFGTRVEDVQVDNGQPFPRSHSAYWWNKQTWDTVLGACA